MLLTVTPPLLLSHEEICALAERLAPATAGLGLEMLLITARMPNPNTGELTETLLRIVTVGDSIGVKLDAPTDRPLEPMAEYEQRVVQLRRRGLTHPFEIVRMLAPPRGVQSALPPGEFAEHDLDDSGRARPGDRTPGKNTANIVVGVVTNFTASYPEGMTPGHPARRPEPRDGHRSPSRSAAASWPRSTSPSELGVSARVVRAVRRREDLDGQRHREHGLDRRGAAPHHRVHAGRRRDQRRRRRASTSARSRTGTPRPRC